MNILVLNGSPRPTKSNTMRLTDAFVQGLCQEESHNVNHIAITSMDIKDCIGCFKCWTNTPGQCVLRDDMAELLSLYCESDLIIWSFPLYYYGMPSRIKAFMDRLLPSNLPTITQGSRGTGGHPSRYDLSGQKHVLISTCGFYAVENNYAALVKQFEILYGDRLGKILCPEGELFQVPQLQSRTALYLEQVREAGREFGCNGALSQETQMRLSRPMVEPEAFIEMSAITYAFMQMPFAPAFGLIDNIAPLAMGVFTVWFARWYPAKVARG